MRPVRLENVILLTVALILMMVNVVYAQEEVKTKEDNATYFWTYKHKKGDSYRIRGRVLFFVTRANNRTVEQQTKYMTRYVVRDVAPNGDVTRTFVTSVSEHSTERTTRDISFAEQPGIQVISPLGIVLQHKLQKKTAGMYLYDQLLWTMNCCPLPPHPVKIGDSWYVKLEDPTYRQANWVIGSTLLGKEKLNGVDMLTVSNKVKLEITDEDGHTEVGQFDWTCYVDQRTGRILRTLATIDNLYTKGPTSYSTISGEIELQLLPDSTSKKKSKK